MEHRPKIAKKMTYKALKSTKGSLLEQQPLLLLGLDRRREEERRRERREERGEGEVREEGGEGEEEGGEPRDKGERWRLRTLDCPNLWPPTVSQKTITSNLKRKKKKKND